MTTKIRTVTEWRVLSSRAGTVKEKRYRTLRAVERRIGLLTSDEPWRFYGDKKTRDAEPNDYLCCGGGYPDRPCGCGGETYAEHAAKERAQYPPLEWVKVEKRLVTTTAWEPALDEAKGAV